MAGVYNPEHLQRAESFPSLWPADAKRARNPFLPAAAALGELPDIDLLGNRATDLFV